MCLQHAFQEDGLLIFLLILFSLGPGDPATPVSVHPTGPGTRSGHPMKDKGPRAGRRQGKFLAVRVLVILKSEKTTLNNYKNGRPKDLMA